MIAFNKINNLIDALNDRSVKLNVEAYEDSFDITIKH